METLENFIEKYLNSKKKTDYEGWLAMYGKDSQESYNRAKAEADNDYASSRAEYGQRAASLYKNGLTSSGYSDYMNQTAYAARSNALARAAEQKSKTDAENREGYRDYMIKLYEEEKKTQEEATEKERSLFSSLLGKNLLDLQSAITYLTTNGMDEGRATELAEQSLVIQRGKESFRQKIITSAISARMGYSAAYQFALYQGVSDDEAREIAGAVAYCVKQGYRNNVY